MATNGYIDHASTIILSRTNSGYIDRATSVILSLSISGYVQGASTILMVKDDGQPVLLPDQPTLLIQEY